MQLQPTAVDHWTGVIADLQTKRQTLLTELTAKREEKRALALEASLGSDSAKNQSQQLSADINKLSLDIDELSQALTQANGNKAQAESQAKTDHESQRVEQLKNLMRAYFNEITLIDQALEKLATRFGTAIDKLSLAEQLMTPLERAPVKQLKSRFGPSMALRHYHLDQFIELERSIIGVSPIHVKPWADYCFGLIDRYIPKDNKGFPGGPIDQFKKQKDKKTNGKDKYPDILPDDEYIKDI